MHIRTHVLLLLIVLPILGGLTTLTVPATHLEQMSSTGMMTNMSSQMMSTTSQMMSQSMTMSNMMTQSTATSSITSPRCVIATAAFGSELAAPVQLLRDFRDNEIRSTILGSAFMNAFNNWYYSWSPPVARAIATNELAKTVARGLITPLIGALHLANGIYQPVAKIDVELAILVAGIFSSATIGTIYLMPLGLTMTMITRRRVKLRGVLLAFILALVLSLYGTLTNGTTGILENLTALIVVETLILTPTLLIASFGSIRERL